MKLLIDTHSFLWFVNNAPQLSQTAIDLISDANNQVCLSVASVWEMAIKTSTGKLALAQPVDIFVPDQLQRNDLSLLPIDLPHTLRVASLPFHHKDPFDRLLIAQSLVEALPIISVDSIFDLYGVVRLW